MGNLASDRLGYILHSLSLINSGSTNGSLWQYCHDTTYTPSWTCQCHMKAAKACSRRVEIVQNTRAKPGNKHRIGNGGKKFHSFGTT